MHMTDLIFARVHAMPCVNRCWHCFCEGGPGGDFMGEKQVLWVLDQLAELRKRAGTEVFPMFYDEPTLHPDFKRIMEAQLAAGLIFDQWWFSTNGYGLARMSDGDWDELVRAGFANIRLTFHGVGDLHDRLVCRKGAYDDLLETIRKAEQHDVPWFAGMVLNSENQAAYEETRDTVLRLGTPCAEFGWMLPQSQGRGTDCGTRVRGDEISRLIKGRRGWMTEKDCIARILSDPELKDRKAGRHLCGIDYLDIGEDLNVYYGGGCDGDPFDFVREQVLLGNMEKEGIAACYEKYLDDPPEPVWILGEATFGELAEKYGDPENDQVFHFTDLTGRKWAEAYLRDRLGG